MMMVVPVRSVRWRRIGIPRVFPSVLSGSLAMRGGEGATHHFVTVVVSRRLPARMRMIHWRGAQLRRRKLCRRHGSSPVEKLNLSFVRLDDGFDALAMLVLHVQHFFEVFCAFNFHALLSALEHNDGFVESFHLKAGRRARRVLAFSVISA